jgi:hypothetical protein
MGDFFNLEKVVVLKKNSQVFDSNNIFLRGVGTRHEPHSC